MWQAMSYLAAQTDENLEASKSLDKYRQIREEFKKSEYFVCVYIYIYIYTHTHTYAHTCKELHTSSLQIYSWLKWTKTISFWVFHIKESAAALWILFDAMWSSKFECKATCLWRCLRWRNKWLLHADEIMAAARWRNNGCCTPKTRGKHSTKSWWRWLKGLAPNFIESSG